MPSILITTSSFDTENSAIAKFKHAGYGIVLNPYARRLTEEEVAELLTPDIVGIIAGVEPLTRKVITSANNLRVISRCGAGLDSVDMDAAHERNIEVCNTPDSPAVAVAELTIGLILSLLRHIPSQDSSIRLGGWDRPMGELLGKKTLGIIGYGRIGRKVSDIAKAFGAQIAYHDPAIKESLSFHQVLEKSDIVSLHIPYTPQSKNLINADAIARMKMGSFLVNAARGGLVNEEDAANALRSGHLAGAAFDVFEKEPYSGELCEFSNVILTPHIGSYAKEARAMQENEAAENLYAALMGNHKEASHG